MRIQNNVQAFNAFRNLSTSQNALGKSLEKLSSGFRINRAADDAAGLVTSEGLRAKIGGLRVASRNAQDGISVVQTAEGALSEVHSILGRMRDLAVQAANTGGNTDTAIAAAQDEVNELTEELDRIFTSTKYGDKTLFSSTADSAFAFQIGADAGDSITLTVESDNVGSTNLLARFASNGTVKFASASSLVNGTTAGTVTLTNTGGAGGVEAFGYATTTTLTEFAATIDANDAYDAQVITNDDGTYSLRVSAAVAGDAGAYTAAANTSVGIAAAAASQDTAAITLDDQAGEAIKKLDAAIGSVSSLRGQLGAFQNRMESTIRNLGVATENLTAAESRIRDADMALETVAFTKNQVLQQAGIAMLAQANVSPQSVLRLLG